MRLSSCKRIARHFINFSRVFVDVYDEESDELPFMPKQRYCLSGHRAGVNFVSFHPTYSLMASASDDGTVKLWDYEQGTFERTLKGHTGNINSVAFDPTGRHMASSSSVVDHL